MQWTPKLIYSKTASPAVVAGSKQKECQKWRLITRTPVKSRRPCGGKFSAAPLATVLHLIPVSRYTYICKTKYYKDFVFTSSGFAENSCAEINLDKVSRRARNGFNLVPCHLVRESGEDSDSFPRRDTCFCYTLPLPNAPKLFLRWVLAIRFLLSCYKFVGFGNYWLYVDLKLMYLFFSSICNNNHKLSQHVIFIFIPFLCISTHHVFGKTLQLIVDSGSYYSHMTQHFVNCCWTVTTADMVSSCSQRWEDCINLNDFEVCNRYDIDNTGLVCK